MNIPQAMARLKKVAGELGLPWGERKRTYNSRLAQELGKWAESKGKGDAFRDAVFRAYFVDGRNIAKPDVLAEVAKTAGLSEKEAGEVLQARSFRDAVDADWSLAGSMGIEAVPTFVIDGGELVGAQPYEALEGLLLDHGVKRR